MANTYTSLHYHIVFSTKNRDPFLVETVRERLFAYLVGIARENGMNALEVGGMTDHVHLLLAHPRTATPAEVVEAMKTGSSKWIKTRGRRYRGFHWQSGYGAFSINPCTGRRWSGILPASGSTMSACRFRTSTGGC